MPLTNFTLSSTAGWKLEHPVDGFQPRVHEDAFSYYLSEELDLEVWDNVHVAEFDLADGASLTIDLFEFENPNEETGQFTSVIAVQVVVEGVVLLEPGASNPLDWFLGSGGSLRIDNGFTWLGRTGETVDATHRNLKFTNVESTAGTESLSVKVLVLGSTTQ